MEQTTREIIQRWFERSGDTEQDVFDRFISLWIAFNAYYASSTGRRLREWQQLQQIGTRHRGHFRQLIGAHPEKFEAFQQYIAAKPINTGFIQDLRYPVGAEQNKKRYTSLSAIREYIECVYQVRCNLFHGGKDIADAQDVRLVTLALGSLSVFLKAIFEQEGIIAPTIASQ